MAFALLCGCGEVLEDPEEETGLSGGAQGLWWMERDVQASRPLHGANVVRFDPGEGAGFGKSDMPGVVLGEPRGGGERQGSLDVVSLGVGGEIVLDFGQGVLRDGPGVDLIVFENAFVYGAGAIFSEPAQVAVSLDGEQWFSFACDVESGEGCAGQTPTMEDASMLLGLDVWEPELAAMVGGDGFDLAQVGLDAVRYVKVTDVSSGSAIAPSAGFDLDAVTALYGVLP